MKDRGFSQEHCSSCSIYRPANPYRYHLEVALPLELETSWGKVGDDTPTLLTVSDGRHSVDDRRLLLQVPHLQLPATIALPRMLIEQNGGDCKQALAFA